MGDRSKSSGSGIGPIGVIGMALAAISSWTLNHSVVWACIHTFFGWLYLLYLCGGCGGGLPSQVFE